MRRCTSLILAALVTAGAAGHAVADEIHLVGTPIALRGCRIGNLDLSLVEVQHIGSRSQRGKDKAEDEQGCVDRAHAG